MSLDAIVVGSYQDTLTLTQTPQAADHAIIAIGAYNTASTTVSATSTSPKDGSAVEKWNCEAPNTAGWQYAGLVQRATLAAIAAIWKWRARAETAGTTVNVGNLAIAVLQLEATPAAARRRCMAVAG